MHGWGVQVGKFERGPYRTRDLAVQVAISRALYFEAQGVHTVVAVLEDEIVEVWPEVFSRDDSAHEVVVRECG
jgi:hypothetical protein